MDAWFGRYLEKHGMFTISVLAVVVAALFIFWPQTTNANNKVSIYEDEMIVSVDDYEALQQSVIGIQEMVKNLVLDSNERTNKLITHTCYLEALSVSMHAQITNNSAYNGFDQNACQAQFKNN